MLVVTSSLAGGSHCLEFGKQETVIHKAGTCGCSGTLNACLLMLENPTLSYFLLAAGSNGLPLVAPTPGSVCSFSPSPFSTALAQKWQRQVTEQCLQLSVANRVYVMYWTSSTRKNNTYKKQSNFSKQSKHAAHDWLYLAQEKICSSSRPSALTEAPTSLSCSRPPDCLGVDLISPNPTLSLSFESSM